MNAKELKKILDDHAKWLARDNGKHADLWGANLRDADLQGAKTENAKGLEQTQIVPQTGAFDAWKKCNDGVIVKLRIPAKAKRSNATGRKCRAEFAKVLDVIGADVGITDAHGPKTEYRKGETVHCSEWNDDRWVECGGGIHFYITREEAENH